jgi:hypothetical protein
MHGHRLAGAHQADLGFLEVGFHIDCLGRHDREQALAGLDVLAQTHGRRADLAGNRGDDAGGADIVAGSLAARFGRGDLCAGLLHLCLDRGDLRGRGLDRACGRAHRRRPCHARWSTGQAGCAARRRWPRAGHSAPLRCCNSCSRAARRRGRHGPGRGWPALGNACGGGLLGRARHGHLGIGLAQLVL